MSRPRSDLDLISTGHSDFLKPSLQQGHPARSLILRGVNLSSTAKFPHHPADTIPEPSDSRSQRDHRRWLRSGVKSHEPAGLWDDAEAGGREGWFNGAPFPLDEADTHLRRLDAWGFTTLRLLVTWEALEHAGPGKYDNSYIDYTIAIIRKCKEHGFRVFISPHQDVFSRFISGSGAPYWALEAVGLNPRRIHQTGAGIIHSAWETQGLGGEEGIKTAKEGKAGEWPDMIWNTNTGRLASRHCETMFWAGDVFAPKCTLDGKPINEYLQSHFNAAYGHFADKLKEEGDLLDSCVIGWDSLNEPDEGFIGIPIKDELPASQDFLKGPCPTPLQMLKLGYGQSVSGIQNYDFTSFGAKKLGKITITPPEGLGVWMTRDEAKAAEERWGWKMGQDWNFWEQDGSGGCIWAGHEVWSPKSGQVIHESYFDRGDMHLENRDEFIEDFWVRHYQAYLSRLREAHPNAIAFVNPPIFKAPPNLPEELKRGRVALSSHYYDGLTMLGKRRHLFNADAVGIQRGLRKVLGAIKIGEQSIKKSMREQLGELKSDADKHKSIAGGDSSHKYPTLIGEIGSPFDMKPTALLGLAQGKRHGFKDYVEPGKAMDSVLNACDGDNTLSYTLWVYEPSNTHKYGDGWNGEDLSIFSYDDIDGDDDLHADDPQDYKTLCTLGSRAVESWCRPYPAEVTGDIKSYSFNISSSEFSLDIRIPPRSDRQEIIDESATEGVGAGAVVGHLGSKGEEMPHHASRSAAVQEERDQRPTWEHDEAGHGVALIYVPFVHYLHQGEAGKVPEPIDIQENRLIGRGSLKGEEWVKGQGEVRVDLEIMGMSKGRVECDGQWMKWIYPIDDNGAEYSLKFRKWKK